MDVARTRSPSDPSLSDVQDDAPPAKRRMTTASHDTRAFPTLPQALLRGLFSSFVHDFSHETIVVAPTVDLPDELRALACVSKEWNALAHDITAEIALSQLSIGLADFGRSDLLELRRRVTLQRKYLQSLTIENMTPHRMTNGSQWDAVLSHVPRLDELHLGMLCSVPYDVVTDIVEAAGRQCQEVQKLTLPRRDPSEWHQLGQHPGRLHRYQTVLYDALAAWSRNGFNGGVGYLAADMSNDITDVATACAYVDTITRLCPSIERSCGFRCSPVGAGVRTMEHWMLDVPTWTRFCASQSSLTTFEWMPIPFATVFFEIFGRFPKPNLRHLDLTPTLNWNWAKHLQDVDEATLSALKEFGFADTAVNVHEVLRACPNLKDLEVHLAPSLSDHDDGREAQTNTVVRGIEIPATKMVNPEIFGDDFCEALATYCPRLGSFIFLPLDHTLPSCRTIRSFTDRGLRSLATMPWLHDVTIETADVTGAGLYSLVVEHNATECSMERRYYLTVGEQFTDTPDHSFYQVAQEFLKLVLQCEGELPCEQHNVTLHLRNLSPASIDRIWSAKYLMETKEIIQQIQEKHPTAETTISTMGYDSGSCSRIEEIVFTVGPKTISVTTEGPEEQIDEIIYNRIAESDEDFGSDEDLESDDEVETAAGMSGSVHERQMEVLRSMHQVLTAPNGRQDQALFATMMEQLEGDREGEQQAQHWENDEEDEEGVGNDEDDDEEDYDIDFLFN